MIKIRNILQGPDGVLGLSNVYAPLRQMMWGDRTIIAVFHHHVDGLDKAQGRNKGVTTAQWGF